MLEVCMAQNWWWKKFYRSKFGETKFVIYKCAEILENIEEPIMSLYSQAKLNFVSHFLHCTQLLMGIGTVGMGQGLMSPSFTCHSVRLQFSSIQNSLVLNRFLQLCKLWVSWSQTFLKSRYSNSKVTMLHSVVTTACCFMVFIISYVSLQSPRWLSSSKASWITHQIYHCISTSMV